MAKKNKLEETILPTGIYKRSKRTKRKMSETLKKRWAKMTKEEKLEYLKPWMEAGRRAMHERFAKMIKEERVECTKLMREAATRKWISMTRREQLKWTKNLVQAGYEANKRFWANKSKNERSKFMEKAIKASQKANPSSIEKAIWKVLDKFGISYKIQVSFDNGKFIVDIYIPNQRLIIECNGDYWHALPRKRKRDKKLKEYAQNNDYRLIELWEHDIKKNPKQALEAGLKKI